MFNFKIMNYNIFILFFSVVMLITACGDDTNENCTVNDWVGTYVGEGDCGRGLENIIVEINEADSIGLSIYYEANLLSFGLDGVVPQGCKFIRESNDSLLVLNVDIELNGDELSVYYQRILNGMDITCDLVAERQ